MAPVKMRCAYCQFDFPIGKDPAADRSAMTQHIKRCQNHPMAKLLQDYQTIRAALVAWIGSDSLDCLKELEKQLRPLAGTSRDAEVALQAINALQSHLPWS